MQEMFVFVVTLSSSCVVCGLLHVFKALSEAYALWYLRSAFGQ